MEHRSVLTRGVLAYKDITEQTPGKFIVSVDPSPVQSMLFWVDDVETTEESTTLVKDREVVAILHPSIQWHVVAAKYASVVSVEDMTRNTILDHKEIRDLNKALREKDPEEDTDGSAAGEVMRKLGIPGQYL